MTVQTLKRSLIATALLLSAQILFASYPPALTGARMIFDESSGNAVLFGGSTATDLGTARVYYPTETWLWIGDHWVQLYPANSPAGRAAHVFVYDSIRSRGVLFGGRNESGDLADTWVFANSEWTQLTPPSSPPARAWGGAAYDRVRDRIMLFGGISTSADGKTSTRLYDTWEFDGTTWTQVQATGPSVLQPALVFDEARNQMLMTGVTDTGTTLMYAWDPSAQTWNQLTPRKLPPCANESALTYQRDEQTVFLVGGVCTSSSTLEEVYTWDGKNWTKLDFATAISRAADATVAYDPYRDVVIMFGGTIAFSSPRNTTYTFEAGDWVSHTTDAPLPGPRSLFSFTTDPVNNLIWLIGGLSDVSYYTDFWTFQNGGWLQVPTAENQPDCLSPLAAFDTDRSKLVVVCQTTADVHEWDGTAWKKFTDFKTKPFGRRFASLVYDPSLKKTVLFGGYDDSNYRNDAWQWDGTSWTEQKKNRAPYRALTSMWFDPVLKKTVIFGGLGRRDPQGSLERFNDMWAFGSDGWKEIKPSALPGQRYGAQAAVDPLTNKTILFGGLKLSVDSKGLQHQEYANDTWQWDGSTWTLVPTATAPPGRENGAMAFDPTRGKIVLFGGWAGYFLSDVWVFDGTNWSVEREGFGRRRGIGPRR